jgi:hypothetical protein
MLRTDFLFDPLSALLFEHSLSLELLGTELFQIPVFAFELLFILFLLFVPFLLSLRNVCLLLVEVVDFVSVDGLIALTAPERSLVADL